MELILEQIKKAGSGFCNMEKFNLKSYIIKSQHRGDFAVCIVCNATNPAVEGICFALARVKHCTFDVPLQSICIKRSR